MRVTGKVLMVTVLAAAGFAQEAAVRPSVGEIEAMERSFDAQMKRMSVEAPVEMLGLTRGVYLPGYGVVFTAEVNLVSSPSMFPFIAKTTPEDQARVRAAKLKRMGELKKQMQQMLVSTASSMDRVPMEERVVLGMVLFYHSWEDRTGLPHRVTMQAKRRALVDVATNRQPASTLGQLIQVREE